MLYFIIEVDATTSPRGLQKLQHLSITKVAIWAKQRHKVMGVLAQKLSQFNSLLTINSSSGEINGIQNSMPMLLFECS